MADQKPVTLIITNHCKIEGKHFNKGQQIIIDPKSVTDRANYVMLVHSNRVAAATPANVAAIMAEVAAEEKILKESAPQDTLSDIIGRAFLKVLQETGLVKTPKVAAA
jgi:hypothetical protein